ncbi:MAG: 50S ribosomal protein L17 [Spirochaetes bacterium GWD1_61_31]|nr:MAG: 50S ribosomal protein L17 [Spirochaetes bacterium GWB1_60_80]OHD29907.1 MAG: 50S ribosomal protein L17 [Spirochaetes bacterium GWC1_61_12]OHD43764.1 MAG: 50S ribosomal protein L17 [Spirochaetes bacterium GWD1_61_31]OHD46006.1 MAG: 50S ribosomal protein L17 [Spirochaetes bacterium GWE1_60_18]OHD60578.1 MAG: 50S ribosomal protein L17 [Spirochaetes bacterium GWF1_60_12]HAP43414.1 50S ribosomal protein L17 [Spirochaetaceae bacterium]
MNHKKGFNKLNMMAAHRKATLRNMATVLFKHERIVTTKAKALEVRRTAEKMITRAKEDSVNNRRLLAAKIMDEGVLVKLFTDIGPRMKARAGGYTRILKMGFRKGDAASMVILELVDRKADDEKTKKDEAKDKQKAKVKAEKVKAKASTAKAAGKKAPAAKAAADAETK